MISIPDVFVALIHYGCTSSAVSPAVPVFSDALGGVVVVAVSGEGSGAVGAPSSGDVAASDVPFVSSVAPAPAPVSACDELACCELVASVAGVESGVEDAVSVAGGVELALSAGGVGSVAEAPPPLDVDDAVLDAAPTGTISIWRSASAIGVPFPSMTR